MAVSASRDYPINRMRTDDFENRLDDDRWEAMTAWQLENPLCRNAIEASVTESLPHLRRAHCNLMAPTFRLQLGSGSETIIMACRGRRRHLPLAARPRVGHIGLTGAVAEWLKAAVC